jgi:hypothetical protein
VTDNTFKSNSAKISGGAIFYDLYEPKGLMNNTFGYNMANYGPNYGSYPKMLKIINNDTNWTQAFVSGRDISATILIGLFD